MKSKFFGDYELIEEISRGGMGLVYRARQLSLNRMVAIKMIHGAHLASPEARMRFRVEVETIAQLNHPNIVSLHEAGEHDGTHFFSMRLVEGTNLSEYVKTNPALRATAQLLVKICCAVHYAHQRGILHRDLKPSNILIDPQGEPHVVDFGLAKTLARQSGFTFHESVLGSPNYMAPEQAAGRNAELTITADVYGIGAIMYEMLTGRPPFQADTPLDTIRKVVDEEPISPRKLNRAVDADLETICLRCLQKSPLSRYSSAEELAKDLERWLEGKPILARPVGRLEQAWRWCRREPALAGALAASLIFLLALGIGAGVAALHVARAEQQATANLRESLLNQVRLLRLSAGPGQRSEGLRLIRQALSQGGPSAFRDRARNEVLALLARNDLQFAPQPSLSSSPDPTLNVIDPQLTRHATLIGSNTIVVRRVADGTELYRFTCGNEPVRSLDQFSHNGKFLALRHLNGLSIWDVETSQLSFATNGPNRAFCFAPNESVVVLEEWDYQATVLDLPSLREVYRVRGTPDPPSQFPAGWSTLALSPDGGRLAAVRADTIEIFDVRDSRTRWRFTNSAAVSAVAWHPNGRRLAAALTNGRFMVWNTANGRPSVNMPPSPAFATKIAFDPSGNLLAAACNDRILRLLDLAAIRYGVETELACDAHTLAFSGDGNRLGLVFRGNESGWLQIVPSAEFHEVNVGNTSTELAGCSFSSDGSILAVGTTTNVAFCDPETGARLALLPGVRLTAFCFDPLAPAVFASGTPGLFRWNLNVADATQVRFSGEQKLFTGRGWRAFTFSANGQAFAAANIHSNAAFVFDRTFTNRLVELGPHTMADSIAISPDRKWVATGSSTDRQIKVWNVATRVEVLALPVGRTPRATFSHDGKWLATFGDRFELRAIGSWQPVPLTFTDRPAVLGAAAFSRDGNLMAIVRDLDRIQLIDLHTLQPLGILQPPGPGEINAIEFSPDGAKLVSVGKSARLRVWNLARIRQALAELNLDWKIK